MTRIIPYGPADRVQQRLLLVGLVAERLDAELDARRNRGSACTIFSPNSVGSVETRKSIARVFDSTSFMRPSCGTRFSAMSSLRDDLDPRRDLVLDRERRLRDLHQDAVEAVADRGRTSRTARSGCRTRRR